MAADVGSRVHDSLSLTQLLNHQVQAIRGGSHLLKMHPLLDQFSSTIPSLYLSPSLTLFLCCWAYNVASNFIDTSQETCQTVSDRIEMQLRDSDSSLESTVATVGNCATLLTCNLWRCGMSVICICALWSINGRAPST